MGITAITTFDKRGQTLADRVNEIEARFPDEVPRPAHWGGFIITPQEIEFWADGAYRLHDSFRFTKNDAGNGKHSASKRESGGRKFDSHQCLLYSIECRN